MRVVIFGPPASGKGTQSKWLIGRFGIPAISTGDLLRAEIASETPIGLAIRDSMAAGQFAPDSVVLNLLRSRLDHPDCANGYVLDGYPRTVQQATLLHELVGRIDLTVHLLVPFHDLVQRMAGRRERAIINGQTPRSDDNVETLRTRYALYGQHYEGLSQFYSEPHHSWVHAAVDATGSAQLTTQRITDIVNTYF